MNSKDMEVYLKAKIETLDELIEASNDVHHRERLTYRQAVFKDIYEDIKVLNGGEE